MPLILIAAPATEPVTSAEVKTSARIDGTEFDTQIAIIIPAIRAAAEHELGRRLITQTVEMVLDEFPTNEIDLTLPDAKSITSVKYLDDSGVEQTLSGAVYSLDDDSTPSRVLLKYGQTWPITQDVPNAVRVRFVVGYGDAAAVPSNVKLWIIAQCCAALDNHAPLPWIDRLLDAERVHTCG